MALKIRNTAPTLGTQRSLSGNLGKLQQNLKRLSTGKRLNGADDDAAALAISQMMNSELRALNQAQRNAMDGVSMLQTAEGGMEEMGSMLSRMRELALQSANGTLSDDQRSALDDEFSALREEVDRVSSTSNFNGHQLLDGSASSGIPLQIHSGPETTGNQIDVSVEQLDSTTLGDGTSSLASQSLGSRSASLEALSVIDGAMSHIASSRADIGAAQNRLTVTVDTLAVERENIMAANSLLEDADVAAEASSLAQNQILTQSSVAMLGQTNRLSASSLRLLE